MRKVLIVGGSGFIGQHLIELLARDRKYDIGVFDLIKPQFVSSYNNFLIGDITNFKNVASAVKKNDLIVDLAGILGTSETFDYVAQVVRVNIEGAVNVFEAAKKYDKPVIYLSLTNDWPNPYTITKQTANRFAQMYWSQFGVKIGVLKALNVYGEYQKFHEVKKIGPQFIVNALLNKPIKIYGNGLQRVDMVDAKDVARGILAAMESGRVYGKSIDLGTGKPVKVIDVAKMIIKLANSKSKIIKVPLRRGEPKNSLTVADLRDLKKNLNFKCESNLEEGLLRTINWYKSQLKNLKHL